MGEDYSSVLDRLRDRGLTPVDVATAGHAQGLGPIHVIRLVRDVCGVSLVDAKDAMTQAVHGQTLVEHWEELAGGMADDDPPA